MSTQNELTTERLLLRRWRAADQEPFAALNADRHVMEFFPARLTRADSDDLIARIETGFDQRGYGFWALELLATGEFVGFSGLDIPSFEAHFTPAVEVGWRLARSAWGPQCLVEHKCAQTLARDGDFSFRRAPSGR